MRHLLLAAALAALPAAAPAAPPPPAQKLVLPADPVAPGELVRVAVSPPSPAPGLLKSTYEWKVFDGTREKVFEVGTSGAVFFAAGLTPRRFLVVAAATHLFADTDAAGKPAVTAVTSLLHGEVVVGDPPPAGGQPAPPPKPPPPEVAPQPPPAAPAPDGRYGLGKLAQALAARVPPAGRARAGALAAAYDAVAADLKAGRLGGAKPALAELKKKSDAALGNETAPWEAWAEGVEDRLFELAKSGALKSDDDFAAAFAEIAQGLKGVSP